MSSATTTLPYPAGSAAELASGRRPGLWVPAISLCQRELVRFVRQKHRIIGALGTPVLFWLLIGGGIGHSFNAPGGGAAGKGGYMAFFFPGTVVFILLSTAIFSTISIIEDRREGFLQSVLVAPISPMVIVLGKVLGGTVLAMVQGLIFLALSPLVGFHFTPMSLLVAVMAMLLMSFALTALGFCIAWRMSSTQGFHAVMNLFLMPMWFLSGALFPPEGVSFAPLRWAIDCNPLSYGLAALRRGMMWYDPHSVSLGGLPVNFAVTVAFAVVMFGLASAMATGRVSGDLQ
jgi:ABC-2 type transport system permease protein